MYLDGMLIPARRLVNGKSVVQEEFVEEVTYFHLEFDMHAVIFAEGAPAESFIDDESREQFDNAGEYRALYPEAIRQPARFCAPRVEDGEPLEAVRRRLRARAEGTSRSALAGSSRWRGNLDSVERGRISGWAQDECEPDRPVMLRIQDNGAPLGRVRADGYRDDLRVAGIGAGSHAFSFSVPSGLAPEISHVIEVRRADDGRLLPGSPWMVAASPVNPRFAKA